jgi:lipid-A-disaccharide synthase
MRENSTNSHVLAKIDLLILSNGPGEITTWVRPVVKALRQKFGEDGSHLRISIVLSPCHNATGTERQIALSYPEVDRVQAAEHFLDFLLWGKTVDNWDWRDRGAVIFLGGDQFFTLVIGKRLGYRTVVYAEWDARWYRWIDRFGVMRSQVIETIPTRYRHKFQVVGDLMTDISVSKDRTKALENRELIGLLPGSKPAKLAQGVPLCLKIAEHIKTQRPQTQFILPVAPTLDLATLAQFADRDYNPIVDRVNGTTAKLIVTSFENEQRAVLETAKGVQIELITQFPAHDFLRQCHLCLTTVGANTAELGSLAIPAIVLLPTQQLDAMRSWDGIPGILANLPGVGSAFAKSINWLVLRRGRLFAWPNKWAGEEIMPELVGELQATDVAEMVLDYLQHPEKLEIMRQRLHSVRGSAGAAQNLAEIVFQSF